MSQNFEEFEDSRQRQEWQVLTLVGPGLSRPQLVQALVCNPWWTAPLVLLGEFPRGNQVDGLPRVVSNTRKALGYFGPTRDL